MTKNVPGTQQIGWNMIEIKDVSKVYGVGAGAYTALDSVSLTIRKNEFFTLLGPSGCGKTTLLRMIAGFDFATSGTLTLDGENLINKPPYLRPVNTVFQSYALFPHMTCAQNIAFGLRMLRKPKDEIARTVAEMLELVQMTRMADRLTNQLSGGQQQRIALARALAPHPKVLLLDEPLSALDFKLRKEMQIELKRLQTQTGITFIFVTHDQEEALTMSDRIAVMSAGKVRQIGLPREIYDQPADRFVADFIGETNFLPVNLSSVDGRDACIEFEPGIRLRARAPKDGSRAGPVTLAVRPEHAEIVPAGAGHLDGELMNIVYFGTGTAYHVRVREGGVFVTRTQNADSSTEAISVGDRVGIRLRDGAAQILGD